MKFIDILDYKQINNDGNEGVGLEDIITDKDDLTYTSPGI